MRESELTLEVEEDQDHGGEMRFYPKRKLRLMGRSERLQTNLRFWLGVSNGIGTHKSDVKVI